ncbi:integrase [Sphingomonas sp. SAFR-052]|uniref:integrase n=1 Tax=Sphingomonas sp. SAFR-052 TaxID=3436867 RepID=UPI003F7DFE53
MATISKRAKGWFVQIRRKGYEPEYRTFPTKDAAQRWAREREAVLDTGQVTTSRRDLKSITFGDLVRRYIVEITPAKLSAESERMRLGRMLKAPVFDLSLAELSAGAVAAYRDARAKDVKPGTIGRELSLMHNVLDIARKEWGIGLTENVVASVRKLPIRNARDRRLRAGELERILIALEDCRNRLVKPAILFAIETAMRRGELLSLTWDAISFHERTAHIPHTKTGYARTVPLTDQGIALLKGMSRTGLMVFDMTPMALKLAWNRVRERAGIPDLRFHDLRHEAISRFAEMGLSIVELSAISGHREPRMLFRYAHIRPSDLSKRLAGRSWEAESREW